MDSGHTSNSIPFDSALRQADSGNGQIASLVAALCRAGADLKRLPHGCEQREPPPSRDMVVDIIDRLRAVLFPGYFGTSELATENMAFYMGSTLDGIQRDLKEQIKRGLCFACQEQDPQCDARATAATREFLSRLPAVRQLLQADVIAAYEGDPAATCPDEAIFCYPGVLAITDFRLAHELYELKVPLIPRIITENAHSTTGIDIHPGATIGQSFFIDHGTGVVIGETTVIGNRVQLYQGVTLGAKSFPLDEEGNPIKGIARHPVVEDDVVIYSGATILGRVTIGCRSVIGGNVWLTRSVPPDSIITQAQTRQNVFEDGGGI